MTRAACYLRVSTKDQTVENQERELRQWADRLGLEVVARYADTASGTRSDRAALTEVLATAHRRTFDVLLIWSLDRLTREGIGATARYLDQLRAAGIRVMGYREAWLDTGGPVGELLIAIFAWVAQQERQRLGERVRAGQARARTAGVHLGRKARAVDLGELRRRRAEGQPWRQIARSLRVPVRTLRRHAEAWQKSPTELCRANGPLVRDSEEAQGSGAR